MTFREKLADLLTNGDYSDALRVASAATEELVRKHNMAQRRGHALREIRDTTATGKSGTARRIHRIAKEALGDD